jgi:signal transduction histidine kinase
VAVIAVACGGDVTAHHVRLGASKRVPGLLIIALLAAAAASAAVSTWAFQGVWRVHANDPSLRSGLDTLVVLCALMSAVLLLANFRQTRLAKDLLLLAGMVTAGLTTFAFNTLPGYGYQTSIYGAGGRSALTILVAGIFVAVAFAPDERRVVAGRRAARLAVPAAVCFVGLGELIDLIAGPVHRVGPAGDFRGVSVVLTLVSFSGLVIAVYGFAGRRWLRDPDAWLLAGAALLQAIAQMSRLTLTVVPQGWLTPSDALRAATYGLMLVVSVRLYRRSQAQRARDAIHGERRRIARDLHDGLAQDLAFIAAHSDRLARDYGSEHPLAVAAKRALAASRGQIIDLEASHASTTEEALRQVARELATRFGVRIGVVVEHPGGADFRPADRRELVRIAREAITNGIRHGGAQTITVTLGSQDDGLLLRVTDDGCGFSGAVSATAGTGLGLQTMRDRAQKLGGRLAAGQSEHGRTQIEVLSVRDYARTA